MVAAACVLLAACTSSAPAPAPETGLVLLSLEDGTRKAEAIIGSDPVAVIVSDDGRTAYLADSSPGDVYAVIWSAAGGFGDPLEREPEKVREDVVDNRSVSIAAARDIYGVVITADGVVDAAATRLLRSGRREANRNKDGGVVRVFLVDVVDTEKKIGLITSDNLANELPQAFVHPVAWERAFGQDNEIGRGISAHRDLT